MWQDNMVTKRFLSKWVPGDFIVGSGGPPLDTSSPPPPPAVDMFPDAESKDGSLDEGKAVELDEEDGEDDDDDDDDSEQAPNPFTDNPMYPLVVSEPTAINVVLFQADRR